MSEPIASTQIHGQLSSKKAGLVDLYHQVLKETSSTNRAQIRPASLKRIAAAEAEAVLNFFEDSNKALARQRGTQLCQVGLGEEALLHLGQATRKFCLTQLSEELRLPAMDIVESYHNVVVQGFIQAHKAVVLEDQKSPRATSQKSLPHYTLQMEVAANIAKATTSILDLHELLNTSVALIQEQFDFYYVGLFLVDEDAKQAVLEAGSGKAGQEMLQRGFKLEIEGQSLIAWCITNGQSRIASDKRTNAVRTDTSLLQQTRSEVVLPLIARDEVIGAMTIQSRQVTTFSKQDLGILQTIADQLAIAIENARLFENVARSQETAEILLQETMAMQQLSQALSGTLNFDEILDIFFQTCTKVLGFDFGVFSLVDKEQQRVKAIAGVGVTEAHLKRANHPLDSKDIMADIIKTGQTELISGWDDRFDTVNFEAESMADWGMRIFTPITLRQENIGLVEVGYNQNVETPIENSRIRLLRAFIDQTALAMDNAKRYEASQRAARREALIKEITTKIRASTNLDTILQTTVKEIGDAINGKRTYVHLVSPTDGQD